MQKRAESTNVAKAQSAKQNFNTKESEWHQNPKHHSPAFDIVKEFVKYTVCESKQVVYLFDKKNLHEAAIKDID